MKQCFSNMVPEMCQRTLILKKVFKYAAISFHFKDALRLDNMEAQLEISFISSILESMFFDTL